MSSLTAMTPLEPRSTDSAAATDTPVAPATPAPVSPGNEVSASDAEPSTPFADTLLAASLSVADSVPTPVATAAASSTEKETGPASHATAPDGEGDKAEAPSHSVTASASSLAMPWLLMSPVLPSAIPLPIRRDPSSDQSGTAGQALLLLSSGNQNTTMRSLPGTEGNALSVRDSLVLSGSNGADNKSMLAVPQEARLPIQEAGSPLVPGSISPAGLPAWLAPLTGNTAHAALPEWAPVTLPAGQPTRWGESLRAELGERMAVQSMHGMDRALIRLDPPAFGSLEIAIRHEAGALTVQLVASHGEVVRQLQAIGDALRQDLSARQYTQVAVEVREGSPGSGAGTGQGRSGRETPRDERTPGRALAENGGDGAAPFTLPQG